MFLFVCFVVGALGLLVLFCDAKLISFPGIMKHVSPGIVYIDMPGYFVAHSIDKLQKPLVNRHLPDEITDNDWRY